MFQQGGLLDYARRFLQDQQIDGANPSADTQSG